MAHLLIFTILSFLTITSQAEFRQHGLINESPMALSPAAVAFFHPESPQHGSTLGPSLPLAATVQSTPGHESTVAAPEKTRLGVGPIVAIPLVFVSMGLIAMGAYYVVNKRRTNLRRASPVQPLQA